MVNIQIAGDKMGQALTERANILLELLVFNFIMTRPSARVSVSCVPPVKLTNNLNFNSPPPSPLTSLVCTSLTHTDHWTQSDRTQDASEDSQEYLLIL